MNMKVNNEITYTPADNSKKAEDVKTQSNTPSGALDSTPIQATWVQQSTVSKEMKNAVFYTPTIDFPRSSPNEALSNFTPAHVEQIFSATNISSLASASIQQNERDQLLLRIASTVPQILDEVHTMTDAQLLAAAKEIDDIQASIAHLEDRKVLDHVASLYNKGEIKEANKFIAEHVSKRIAEATDGVNDPTPLGSAIKEVNTLVMKIGDPGDPSNVGDFNYTAVLLALMLALNTLRELANKVKQTEREMTLNLGLESAKETRKAGEEQMKAGVIAAAFTILAGIVSIGGALLAAKWGNDAGKDAKKDVLKAADAQNKDINDQFGEVAKEANKAFRTALSSTQDKWMSIFSGGSSITKAIGEWWSATKQTDIAEAQAKGKEFDTYGHNASKLEDDAKTNMENLKQVILKALEMLSNYLETKNRAIEQISQKV